MARLLGEDAENYAFGALEFDVFILAPRSGGFSASSPNSRVFQHMARNTWPETHGPFTESTIIMDAEKRERLEKVGFRVGTVAEFLGLTQAESDLIEIKLAFTDALKRQRTTSGLLQSELAEKIGSSQSRIAKMESGDPHVSLDLMIRALLAAGMTRGEMADVIAGKQSSLAGAQEHAAPSTSNSTGRKRTTGNHAQTLEAAEA